jgi:hypothetical protein
MVPDDASTRWPDCQRVVRGLSELGRGDRVTAEETVQFLHFADGIVRLVERLEPRQFRLDETRERFDRRCDGEFFAGLLARDEFVEAARTSASSSTPSTSCAKSIGTWPSWRSIQRQASSGRPEA